MKKHFDELNKILINCISKVDIIESCRDTTRDMNKSLFDPNEINFNKIELDKLTKTELRNASVHFNTKYKDIFETVKKDIYENVKDRENAKLIYRKFLNEFVIK